MLQNVEQRNSRYVIIVNVRRHERNIPRHVDKDRTDRALTNISAAPAEAIEQARQRRTLVIA